MRVPQSSSPLRDGRNPKMAGKKQKQKPIDKRAKREIITSIAITVVLFGIGLLLARLVFRSAGEIS